MRKEINREEFITEYEAGRRDFRGAIFEGAQYWRGVNFADSILDGANFQGHADCTGSCFDRASMVGAQLSFMDFTGASFRFANLTAVAALECKWVAAKLYCTCFADAALDAGNFQCADMTKAVFTRANLGRADLCYVNLRGADLSEARLFNTKIVAAYVEGVRWPPKVAHNRIENCIFGGDAPRDNVTFL